VAEIVRILMCVDVVPLNFSALTIGSIVALSVECQTCDQEFVGSTLGQAHGVKTLGKFLTTYDTKQYKLVPAKGRWCLVAGE